MGLLALQSKQYDHAIEWIARANQQDIRTDHLFGLGTALEQQGQRKEVEKLEEVSLPAEEVRRRQDERARRRNACHHLAGRLLALAGLAVSAPQPPGSTFKIITLSAALTHHKATPSSIYPVRTAAVLSGVTLRNAGGDSVRTAAQPGDHGDHEEYARKGKAECGPGLAADRVANTNHDRRDAEHGEEVQPITSADKVLLSHYAPPEHASIHS